MKQFNFFIPVLLVLVSSFSFFTRVVTGTVTDDAGTPLITQIQVKGTQKKVSSSSNGAFSIEIPGDQAVLVVSAAGYQSKEIAVGSRQTLQVRLSLQPGVKLDTTAFVVADDHRLAELQNLTRARTLSASMAVQQQALSGRVAGLAISGRAKGKYAVPQVVYDEEVRLGGIPNKRERVFETEGYDRIVENPFLEVSVNPLSTFSIDVDAASYSNVRRILNSGRLPEEGAVRIEEMINYFSYEYAQPVGKDPFAVHTELAVCPWNKEHQLALIGLQGKKIDASELPPANLTFLVDVSGSMSSYNKLPLVKASLKLLVDQLRPKDNVSIVVYAGNAGLVLPPTEGDRKMAIKEAIDRLDAGGSTAGGEGIRLAYKVARDHFNPKGNNRVILCTDGDFNVGVSSDDALEKLIEQERKSGVFLTVLGYGMGNYQDAKMQKLADKGNGNHAYIDDISEAKKVLVNEFGGTLFTIAKDVKLQVEFNPAKVKGYRLIGYENRMLAKEDFNNDQKDAGELGSGHTVTAIYELVPAGASMPSVHTVDPLRYQVPLMAVTTEQKASFSSELMHIKLRYKQPDGEVSALISHPVKDIPVAIEKASDNFRFATAVASFGMLLRHSQYKGDASFGYVSRLAAGAKGDDKEGYRKEFIQLVQTAAQLSREGETAWNENN